MTVAALVLNWNNYPDTAKCLDSLLASDYSALRVIVVDNGSHDGSADEISRNYPGVTLIRNEHNLGFSRGCNPGIVAALADPLCKYVLLLNNDGTIRPDAVRRAVEAAERDPGIGVVTGKILHSETLRRIWFAGGKIDRVRGVGIARGYAEIDRGQYDRDDDVTFASGAAMMVRRDVFETVGLLPEEYFFGTEEYDFSLQVVKAGYRIRFVPGFEIIHPGDGSHWNAEPKYIYNGYRNRLIFQRKYLPMPLFLVWKLAIRVYANVAPIVWRRNARRYGYREGPLREMKIAMISALNDDGRDELTEETLAAFDARLRGMS